MILNDARLLDTYMGPLTIIIGDGKSLLGHIVFEFDYVEDMYGVK